MRMALLAAAVGKGAAAAALAGNLKSATDHVKMQKCEINFYVCVAQGNEF